MWKTWSFTNLFEYLPKGKFYQPLWQEIVRQGVEVELAECKAVLDDVHAYLRDVPLEQEELEAIAESLEVLGLGETVPPPGFEPPLVLLSRISSVGSA